MRRATAPWTVMAFALAASLPARAQGDDGASPAADEQQATRDREGARELFEEAEEHYRAGRYQDAAALYERSYGLSGAEPLLFNVAQCRRLLGDCAGALDGYRRFIERTPAGRDRADAETLALKMEACLAARPPAPAPAATAAAGPPPSRDPAVPLIPVAVAARASTATTASRADAGATPTPREAGRGRRAAGVALVGAGAAALLGTAFFLYRGHESADRVEGALADHPRDWGADLQAEQRRGETANRTAAVLGGAAALAAAVGTWLWLGARAQPASAQLSAWWQPGGPGVACTARF